MHSAGGWRRSWGGRSSTAVPGADRACASECWTEVQTLDGYCYRSHLRWPAGATSNKAGMVSGLPCFHLAGMVALRERSCQSLMQHALSREPLRKSRTNHLMGLFEGGGCWWCCVQCKCRSQAAAASQWCTICQLVFILKAAQQSAELLQVLLALQDYPWRPDIEHRQVDTCFAAVITITWHVIA